MVVYVTLCSYNGDKLTHRVLDEIAKAGIGYKLIMLEDQDTGRVGLPKARNWVLRRALEQSDCTFICSISNDPYNLPENWLMHMVQFLEDNPKYGAVTAGKMVNYGDGKGWGNFDPVKGAYGQWWAEDSPIWTGFELDYPQVGTLFVARKDAIAKTGLMDEDFGMGGYEDIDYALRLWSNQYGVRFLGRIHYRYDLENPLQYDMQKSANYFAGKWGTENANMLLSTIKRNLRDFE